MFVYLMKMYSKLKSAKPILVKSDLQNINNKENKNQQKEVKIK